MTFARFFGFILILALSELWFFPLPFCFVALFLWQQLYSQKQALIGAFLAGFLFDIFLIRPLGTTSFVFIVLLFLNTLYRRKYASTNILFLAASMFVSTFVLELFLYKNIAIAASITSTLITVLFAHIFSTKENRYESWHRIS